MEKKKYLLWKYLFKLKDADVQWFWLVQFCGLLISQTDFFFFFFQKFTDVISDDFLLKYKKKKKIWGKKYLRIKRIWNTFSSQL